MARLGSALLVLAATVAAPTMVAGYSFAIENEPQQCSNLSISITGSGAPPYSALILPFGSSPLPNGIEARKIIQHNFTGTSTTLVLNYPTDSQFVMLVSDSSGFGSGGTSAAATVQSSDDSTCYSTTHSVSPEFFINVAPANQMVAQCQGIRIWWDPSTVNQTVVIFGSIPGGDSFAIPSNNLSTVAQEGVGFTWIPTVRTGTTLLLGGGYADNFGAGGSIQTSIAAGLNPDSSCLSDNSPSSTPGSPAGGSYPTSTSGAGTGGGGGTNVGAIVGGVIGGLAALAALILALFFYRRSRRQKRRETYGKQRPDLFNDHDDAIAPVASNPENDRLQPVPYVIPPEPSEAGWTENVALGRLSDDHRRLSTMTGSSILRPSTPGTSTAVSSNRTRKTGMPPSLRPVNIIQHDDAGSAAGDHEEEEAETVELPPAYTNIRRDS